MLPKTNERAAGAGPDPCPPCTKRVANARFGKGHPSQTKFHRFSKVPAHSSNRKFEGIEFSLSNLRSRKSERNHLVKAAVIIMPDGIEPGGQIELDVIFLKNGSVRHDLLFK